MKRHPRRSDEEWLNIIHECRTSGLSDKIWCEEHHIQPSKFYYHIRRLRAKACEITEREDTLPRNRKLFRFLSQSRNSVSCQPKQQVERGFILILSSQSG